MALKYIHVQEKDYTYECSQDIFCYMKYRYATEESKTTV